MAKSLKQARAKQNANPMPVENNEGDMEMEESVVEAPVQVNTKEDKGKLREELALIRAEIPEGMKPVSVELDSDSIIKQAWSDFKDRAIVTPLTTQEMVDATKMVIQLVEDGHTWDDSEELRRAFRKVPNSFAKGPVISTGLQLLCGKVAKFDSQEIPIYRTGAKIGSRWVYQDDMGFFRTIGRFPVSIAEAASDESKTADNQGTHTFLSHSVHFEGVDFWCTEPQHQLHDHITSRGIKKPVSSGKKVDTKEDQAAALKQRLATYERLHCNASDETTKRTAAEKISFIQQKLAELEAA
jgi:hypothetical protein